MMDYAGIHCHYIKRNNSVAYLRWYSTLALLINGILIISN